MTGVSSADLTHAGALLIGLLIGVALTLKLLKLIVEYLKRERED